jgi:DNA transformation protein
MPRARESAFVQHIVDQMQILGGVLPRKMFGGWGIFKNGLMFAVVIHDALYFKVDDQSIGRFEALGLKPFTYEAKGRSVALRYYQAPAEALEDTQAMAEWAGDAYACALRHHKAPKARR